MQQGVQVLGRMQRLHEALPHEGRWLEVANYVILQLRGTVSPSGYGNIPKARMSRQRVELERERTGKK